MQKKLLPAGLKNWVIKLFVAGLMLSGCAPKNQDQIVFAQRKDRRFLIDNVLHTDDLGDIHFSLKIPDDHEHPYALHIALPGWEGLYFQGAGTDLKWEYLPFKSSQYVDHLMVASLQLNSWDEASALQVIRLTTFLMDHYLIDNERVYISGYSAGGETLSHVLALRPDLYRRALFIIKVGWRHRNTCKL